MHDQGLCPQRRGVARWPVGRVWFKGPRGAVLGFPLSDCPIHAPGPQKFG
jgi:hypothetical protein